MFPVLTTRFNTSTWNENLLYRQKFSCCIYGSPREISPKIRRDAMVYMIEMNNDLNQIIGIGLIKNRPFDRYMTSLYGNGNYTRYVYKSDCHIERDFISTHNPKLVEVLDLILFKGKTHLKRGYGFVTLTDKLMRNERCSGIEIQSEIAALFALSALLVERKSQDNQDESNSCIVYQTQPVPVPTRVAPPIPPTPEFIGAGIGI